VKHSRQGDGFRHTFVAFPDHASLAALRAWYEGISAGTGVDRYLAHTRARTQSSRGIIGRIRRRLVNVAQAYGRDYIAAVFTGYAADRTVWLKSSYPYQIIRSAAVETTQSCHVAKRSFSMAR
jgi:hypothetical protein